MRLLILAGLVAWSGSLLPILAQEVTLAESLRGAALDVVLGATDPRDAEEDLSRRTVLEHGSVDPLTRFLESRAGAEGDSDPRSRERAIRLGERVLRRAGELRRALSLLEQIPESHREPRDLLSRAEILDALGRNDDARAAYDAVLGTEIATELRHRVLLRKALLAPATPGSERSPLAVFATDPQVDQVLRNQAAMVLALGAEPKVAIGVYQPRGEGTARFAECVRLADWALDADDAKAAQEFAWQAVHSARMKRDQRYALTVLAETYRRTEELDRLVDRFAAEAAGLSAEARSVWIQLLRETERYDEALRLFQDTGNSARFGVDARRELLDLCRQTGRDQVLVEGYREAIAADPARLEWREGLSRFYLERGDRSAALEVWSDHPQHASTPAGLLAWAASLKELGLDELALEFADRCSPDASAGPLAQLFVFELEFSRGRAERAAARLEALEPLLAPTAALRGDLADAWVRLGRKDRGVDVLTRLIEARGAEGGGEDAEMQLGLLLSEVGDEDKALDRWMGVWRRVKSIPRRRYVEDRIMTVAARLGRLARLAVDLERRLAEGKGDELDAGLLVRIYTKAKDPVSATEIIGEYLRKSGREEADVLNEIARVFLSCVDTYNYEKTIHRLIAVDPENAADYLRQLAMSNLERGQRREAREILSRLGALEADTVSDEFEAGILALAGMREEAVVAYRKALARNPGRIDTFLLLSNVEKELGRHEQSAAMFQFLAETTTQDDLFTVAVDGLLNMRDGRANRGAPSRLVDWARRITLERVAARPDKLYLYQLVADLCDELNDRPGGVRALAAALPIAGEQRTALLRELMTLAGPSEGGRDLRMFGRRLLGQDEIVPPAVYLELGESFLAAQQPRHAARTFDRAARLPEFAEMQPKVAESFERAGYPEPALEVYRRRLSVDSTDLSLMAKVADLEEEMGNFDVAGDLRLRALTELMDRQLLSVTERSKERPDEEDGMARWYRNRNVDETEVLIPRLIAGVLPVVPAGRSADRLLEEQSAALARDLEKLRADPAPPRALSGSPRVRWRLQVLRRLGFAYGHPEVALATDLAALAAFPDDSDALGQMVDERIADGRVRSAQSLIEKSGLAGQEIDRLLLRVGAGDAGRTIGLVSVAEAHAALLPLLLGNDPEKAARLLERVDLSIGTKDDLRLLPALAAGAAYLGRPALRFAFLRHWITLVVRQSEGSIYEPLETILAIARSGLDSAATAGLVEHLVEAFVAEPQKAQAVLYRLPELQRIFGRPLLTAEQAKVLIAKRLEQSEFVYGVPQLIQALPPESRGEALRAAWPKIAKTMRAVFVLQYVATLDRELEDEERRFLVSGFRGSLADVDNPQLVEIYADDLTGRGADPTLSIQILDLLIERKPQSAVLLATKALALSARGDAADAMALVERVLPELVNAKADDYRQSSALRAIFQEFGRSALEGLLAQLDAIEQKSGPSALVAAKRLELLSQFGTPEAQLGAILKAAEAHQRDLALQRRARAALLERGRVLDAIDLQSRVVQAQPTQAAERTQLVSLWQRVANPVRAKEVQDAAPKRGVKVETKDANDAKEARRAPPDLRKVKAALDTGDLVAARSEWHRYWRLSGVLDVMSSGGLVRIMRAGGAIVLGGLSASASASASASGPRLNWPTTVVRRNAPTPDRGGLPSSLLSESSVPPEAAREVTGSVLSDLLAHDFGQAEIAAQLRSTSPSQVAAGSANPLLAALNERDLETKGREALESELVETIERGDAGPVEIARLLLLLEKPDAGGTSRAAAVLDDLLRAVAPDDTSRLQRLARLCARRGDVARAESLYLWCAGIAAPGSPDTSLLDDVVANLSGAARLRVVDAILGRSDPGPDHWNRDGWILSAFRAYEAILPADEALVRCENFIRGILAPGQVPQRQAAAHAAVMVSRRGSVEQALALLERAICSLEPGAGVQEHLRARYTTFGGLTDQRIAALFPARTDAGPPLDWYREAAAAIQVWMDAKRMHLDLGFRMTALLAVRLAELSDVEAGADLFARLLQLAGADVHRTHWVLDVARGLGREDQAVAMERDLLARRVLNVHRVAEVIRRWASTDPVAAESAAKQALEWTLPEDLLTFAIEQAEQRGDETERARWIALRTQAWPQPPEPAPPTTAPIVPR